MTTGLTRDDIVLLMEAYRNQMEAYAGLAATHETIINNEKIIVEKQIAILAQQQKQLSSMETHMGNCVSCKTDQQVDTVKILSQIKWAWVGMGSIIIALISLGWKLLDAISHIEKICGGTP